MEECLHFDLSFYAWVLTQVVERLTVVIAASHHVSFQDAAIVRSLKEPQGRADAVLRPLKALAPPDHGCVSLKCGLIALNGPQVLPASLKEEQLYHIEAFELSHVAVSQAQGSVDVGQDLSQPETSAKT